MITFTIKEGGHMKKLIFAACMLCLAVSLAEAVDLIDAPPGDSGPGEITRYVGTIIDNMCARAQKPEALGGFVKTHTKGCALMPSCVASGYSIYTRDGRLLRFDMVSNIVIEGFLKEPDNKLSVIVEGQMIENELNLVSIESQR